jgi:membrane protein implicated in regulation of membrane protease activity
VDVLTGLGLSIPAGLNAYIPLLAVALAERFGWLSLREPFDVLGTWWMIAIIAVLLVIEIVADKIPAVDHVNDVFQSVIRPAAGAIVAVAGSGNASVSPWVMVVIGVLLAGGMHAAKATARPVINAGTAGVGAAMVSTAEDAGAVAMSAIAIAIPILVIFILAGLLYVLWWMWRRRRRKRREATEKEAAEREGTRQEGDVEGREPEEKDAQS